MYDSPGGLCSPVASFESSSGASFTTFRLLRWSSRGKDPSLIDEWRTGGLGGIGVDRFEVERT